jgi:hypothetical protein
MGCGSREAGRSTPIRQVSQLHSKLSLVPLHQTNQRSKCNVRFHFTSVMGSLSSLVPHHVPHVALGRGTALTSDSTIVNRRV